jgi:hypothetical protein
MIDEHRGNRTAVIIWGIAAGILSVWMTTCAVLLGTFGNLITEVSANLYIELCTVLGAIGYLTLWSIGAFVTALATYKNYDTECIVRGVACENPLCLVNLCLLPSILWVFSYPPMRLTLYVGQSNSIVATYVVFSLGSLCVCTCLALGALFGFAWMLMHCLREGRDCARSCTQRSCSRCALCCYRWWCCGPVLDDARYLAAVHSVSEPPPAVSVALA